jgi:hypothetical protein
MGKTIAVLIGDLIGSRKAGNRADVQSRLIGILERINGAYAQSIVARMMVTGGDGFEGAFKDALACCRAFEDIERGLFPVRVRGGIGVGETDTKPSELVTEMDGPAFHRAREALQAVKGKKSCLLLSSESKKIDGTANTVLRLLWAIRGGWTGRQREVAFYYLPRALSSPAAPTQEEIAEHFGVSQPAITKVLSSGSIKAVRDAEEFLNQLLDEATR